MLYFQFDKSLPKDVESVLLTGDTDQIKKIFANIKETIVGTEDQLKEKCDEICELKQQISRCAEEKCRLLKEISILEKKCCGNNDVVNLFLLKVN